MGVTFTIDLEDPTGRYAPQGRYVGMTHRLLDLCEEMGCRATFFTVGRVAKAAPDLIRAIAAHGHEIAYHSHAHVPLTNETPERFRCQTAEDKIFIEQLTGKPVTGFRAPRFSLTPQSLWVVDSLKELGFAYSSSIMPTKASLYGFPHTPHTPFRWPNGLIELPLPVASVFGHRMPYLGGIYLYVLPSALTQRWMKHATTDEILWTYTHPYDVDRDESFAAMPHTPLWISAVLWLSRRVAEKKIRQILVNGTALPLGERLPANAAIVYL